MKFVFKRLLFVFIGIVIFSFCLNVSASSNITIGVNELYPGIKICAQSSIFSDKAYIYGWKNSSTISAWPGEEMIKDEDGYYCYTVQENKTFTKVVFNNNYNSQTIDLSTIRDSSNLINKYLYVFNSMYDGKYIGEWYVYDKSGLTTLVSSSSNKVNSRLKYTKATYNTLKTEYDNSSSIINYPNPYESVESPLVVHRDDSTGTSIYSSPYIDAYNGLSNAIEGLENRVPIVINNEIITGVVEAEYADEASNDNYVVGIDAEPVTGYDLKAVRAYKITGYNSGEPILGDELEVTTSGNRYYTEFTQETAEEIKGVYIDASFQKKVYKISFTIDKNGRVVYIKDGSEFDIDDVVEVEHGSDFLARIIANEGYTLKSATINGTPATITNNYLEIQNVGADQTVEITFTIKTYTISIDDQNYVFPHGTTYDEILKKIDTNRDGYTFIGLIDRNGKRVSKDYKVTGNDTLYTLFRNDSDIVNPETGMNILKVIILFMIVSTLLYINGKRIEKNKKKKTV